MDPKPRTPRTHTSSDGKMRFGDLRNMTTKEVAAISEPVTIIDGNSKKPIGVLVPHEQWVKEHDIVERFRERVIKILEGD